MVGRTVFILEEHLDDEGALDLSQYTHLRAYHACRPLCIDKYLVNGVQVIQKKQALQESQIRIKSDYVDADKIKKIFRKHWQDFDDIYKRVWLQVNKEELLSDSGHYLIYGSEFINALATELGCKSSLKGVGIPTIFHCDIPMEDIDGDIIMEIERSVMSGDTDDISIAVAGVISCNIVDYEHPKEVQDPYYGYSIYRPSYKDLVAKGYLSNKVIY